MPLDIHIHLPIEDIKKMRMINNQILVEVFDTRNKTVSGIELPITQDNPFIPDRGLIFKKPDSVTCFNIGDCVIIEKYKGKRILSDDGRQFILLDASYILCVIEEEQRLGYTDKLGLNFGA